MTVDRVAVDPTDDDDDIGVGLEREDAEAIIRFVTDRVVTDGGIKFFRGLLYGLGICAVFWVTVAFMTWVVTR